MYFVYIDAKQKKKEKKGKNKLQDDNTKTKTCFYFKKSQEYFKKTKNKISICKEDGRT